MLNTFADFNRHLAEFDRLFALSTRVSAPPAAGPRFNLVETDEAWLVQGLLPGWSANNIDVSIEDGVLIVSGEHAPEAPEGYRAVQRERRDLSFKRTLRLHDEIDQGAISASARDGVLTVTLPRKPAAQPRRIPVTVG